jgi:hypothetical protein
MNLSVNSIQDAKTILWVLISCLTMRSVKVTACPVLQNDKA